MSLQKSILESAFKAALDKQSNRQVDPAAARAEMARDMANAVDAFIKSGTVTVASGIAVATTGSAAAQTGATTATGTGTIS